MPFHSQLQSKGGVHRSGGGGASILEPWAPGPLHVPRSVNVPSPSPSVTARLTALKQEKFMKALFLVGIALSQLAYGALKLNDYVGTYECVQIIKMPSMASYNRVPVKVTLNGKKAIIKWDEPEEKNVTFESGPMSNGYVEGDFEARTMNPVTAVTLSKTAIGKYLTFSFGHPENSAVGSTCVQKQEVVRRENGRGYSRKPGRLKSVRVPKTSKRLFAHLSE